MNNHIEVIKAQKTGLFTNYIFKAIPLAFDESMSYYECLCGLLDYLKNTIIPTVNNNADAIVELQNNVDSFETNITSDFNDYKTLINNTIEQLEDYINNYFDNLDVQDEINNKLDEMVQDGTFDQIINTNITGTLSNLNTTDKSNLVSAINEVNNKTTYSTNETICGKWINDKPIYRKVVEISNIDPPYINDTTDYTEYTGSYTKIPTGIENIEYMVNMSGCIYFTNKQRPGFFPINFNFLMGSTYDKNTSTTDNSFQLSRVWQIYFSGDDNSGLYNQIVVRNFNSASDEYPYFKGYVILEYTKSTD